MFCFFANFIAMRFYTSWESSSCDACHHIIHCVWDYSGWCALVTRTLSSSGRADSPNSNSQMGEWSLIPHRSVHCIPGVLSLSSESVIFSINFRIVSNRFSVTPPNNAQLVSLPLWRYGECVHGCWNRWLMVAMIPTINRNESCIIMQQRFIETTWINITH